MATIETVPAQYTVVLDQTERDALESVVMRAAVRDGDYSEAMRLAEALFYDNNPEGFWTMVERYRSYKH